LDRITKAAKSSAIEELTAVAERRIPVPFFSDKLSDK